MAKTKEKAVAYKYPSRFGSHREMVVEEIDSVSVLCEDEHGRYITQRDRLDDGLADPNRWAEGRLSKFFNSKKKE